MATFTVIVFIAIYLAHARTEWIRGVNGGLGRAYYFSDTEHDSRSYSDASSACWIEHQTSLAYISSEEENDFLAAQRYSLAFWHRGGCCNT